jgi:SAM-dependent methyltransferase
MDGLLAIGAMLNYSIIDDMYAEDAYGSHILADLQDARRFNRWMGDVLRPFLGDQVLEIGAGIGTLTAQFIPRDQYLASDINPNYLHYLRSYSVGKPYLQVAKVDAGRPEDFAGLSGRFDTVLMVNVLEHVPDEATALRNVHNALCPGGRAVILVPQHPRLFNSLDVALEHRERYTAAGLRQSLERGGFEVERIFDFNRTSVPAWFTSGSVFRRKRFSRVQLKVLELAMPVVRRLDFLWPWHGLSLIAVGRKP